VVIVINTTSTHTQPKDPKAMRNPSVLLVGLIKPFSPYLRFALYGLLMAVAIKGRASGALMGLSVFYILSVIVGDLCGLALERFVQVKKGA
jgi:hypothetical protein